MMEIIHSVTADEFCNIQESVGFGRPNQQQVQKALDNSLYVVGVKMQDQVVGMGRLVGDLGRIVYIQDLFIMPQNQRMGIGSKIMDCLMEYIKNNAIKGTTITIGLMSAISKEEFYIKHGFRTRPNEKEGCGMVRGLKIE